MPEGSVLKAEDGPLEISVVWLSWFSSKSQKWPFGLGTEVLRSHVQLQGGFSARQVGTGANLGLNRSHFVHKQRKKKQFFLGSASSFS